MYNLIVGTIAGIVLGVLSVAGIWYGGAVYQQARLRAALAADQSAQQQVTAALTLYETDGGRVSSLGDDGMALSSLVGLGILRDVPPGTWRIRKGGDQLVNFLRVQTSEACAMANKLAGLPEICPPCDSETLEKYPACELPNGALAEDAP